MRAHSSAQGIVGETYNRMLVGVEALRNPESKYYLPDDYQFHGKGSEADYAVHSYFGETATSMFGIKVSPEINCRPLVHGLPLGVLV